MIEKVPQEWFASEAGPLNFFFIAELGLIKPAARAALLDEMSGKMWPLVFDDEQPHLVSDGPWLFQLEPDQKSLSVIDPLLSVSHAWIAAFSEGQQLSRQFAPALCCISPTKEVRFLRFYCPEIIEILQRHTGESWFGKLFANLYSWHSMSANGEFRMIFNSSATAPLDDSGDWVFEVSDRLWSELSGDPEVEFLVECLSREAPEVMSGLSGAEKRRKVGDCLIQADELGVETADDRRSFVYLRMAASGDEETSGRLLDLARRAVQLQVPLFELLETEMGYRDI